MRISLSLFISAFTIACGGSSPGAVPATDAGDGVDAPTPHDEPVDLVPGCAYAIAIEPVHPVPSGEACLEERLSLDGTVLERTERRVEAVGTTRVTTAETWNAGILTVRLVSHHDASDRIVFESVEHLTLGANATLPYTYGQPATYSVAYERDSSGRVVRRALDLAIDGTVDDEERWTFGETDVAVEHTSFSGGQLVRTETWRADGEPLASMDAGENGMRWTYGPEGLMERVDTIASGLVTESMRWTMLAPGQPLTSAFIRVITSAGGERTEELHGETTWTYDDAGRQRVSAGWGRVYGFDRQHRTEWDEQGRETLYVEETETTSCQRYERVTAWAPSGKAVLDELTTCDGELFEHVWSDLDEQDRPTRTERIFVGNANWIVHELDNAEYDSCGARVFREHFYDETLTLRDRVVLDELGRVVTRTSESRTSPSATSSYQYAADGQVLAMDGRSWSYDAQGRVTRTDYGATGLILAEDEPPTRATRLIYECD